MESAGGRDVEEVVRCFVLVEEVFEGGRESVRRFFWFFFVDLSNG